MDQDIEIINNQTRLEKFKNFFLKKSKVNNFCYCSFCFYTNCDFLFSNLQN